MARAGSCALGLVALGCAPNNPVTLDEGEQAREVGTLRIQLEAELEGVQYRLAASFRVQAQDSSEAFELTSTDELSSLRHQLASGHYTVSIQPGFRVSREVAGELVPVPAELHSLAVQSVRIAPGETTLLGFRFAVLAGDVEFGPGELEVGFAVTADRCERGRSFAVTALPLADAYTIALELADIDGDGALDVVSADGQLGAVDAHLNQGQGRFAEPLTLATGDSVVGLAVADVSGDGHPDLMLLGWGGTIQSYFNRGDGTFDPGPMLRVPDAPTSITAADMNADGYVDLIVTSTFTPLTILLNRGDGSFAGPITAGDGLGSGPLALAVADLDGAGGADLVVASGSDVVESWLQRDDGAFQAISSVPAFQPRAVAAADLDDDGHVDLAYTSGVDRVVGVAFNDGVGNLSGQLEIPTGSDPYLLVATDVDGDARPDLVVTDTNTRSVWLLGNAGGRAFRTPVDFDAGTSPLLMRAGDLDADGRIDFVVSDQDGNANLLRASCAP